MKQPADSFTPWYKEPWPWLIIGIMGVTVCWGIFQVVFTFSNADSVVVDDYYKSGKAINRDLTRDQNAKTLGIIANIVIDDLLGEVRVKLSGPEENLPEQLKFSLLSPVSENKDKLITLNRSVSGEYVGQLSEEVTGVYYVQLETINEPIPEVGYEAGWRLNQKMAISPGITLTLGK
ncbi:FixH family protein [Candidatus Sororendozoicomonas aggregata]|uniref:FixH family protein n=1 Tax=Candidatus Sororendozoicomonas aggregata TaxID=3073239 RepID=UPI002ED2C9BC